MRHGTCAEVSAHIEAPPAHVYGLVSDVRRMGEWSRECRSCEWIDGAQAPSEGARFRGHSRRGLARWTTELEVLSAREGEEFGFVTLINGRRVTKWRYRFEPDDGGTRVTESFELVADMPRHLVLAERVLMGITDRRADLMDNMVETLRRLRIAAEGDVSTPNRNRRRANE